MTQDAVIRTFGLAALLCATTLVATLHIAVAQEAPKNFVLLDKPNLAATIAFNDAEGHPRSLADFRGKVVLLNIWATWCVPCRTEMPALDRLQESLGGADFEVVPVSIDRGGMEAIRKFYNENGIRDLAMYVDTPGDVLRQARALGLPTTLLIDRIGREIGRVIGPAQWDAPEIAEFLKPFITNRAVPVTQADRADSQSPSDQSSPLRHGLDWLRALLTR
jgi:thiol-disulfide isomerase/thioredoxin